MDRLKEGDCNYDYETDDLLQDIPKDKVMKDKLYAIKAIAVDNYRVLLVFSRDNINQGKITEREKIEQKKIAFNNFEKAERHICLLPLCYLRR